MVRVSLRDRIPISNGVYRSELKRQAKVTAKSGESDEQEIDANVSLMEKNERFHTIPWIRNITRLDCSMFRVSNKRVKQFIHINILYQPLYEILLRNIII